MANPLCHVLCSKCPSTIEHLHKYKIWVSSQFEHSTRVSLCSGLQGRPCLSSRTIAVSSLGHYKTENDRNNFNPLVKRICELTASATSSDAESANVIVETEDVSDEHNGGKIGNETAKAIMLKEDVTDNGYGDNTGNETLNAFVETEDIINKEYRDKANNKTANTIAEKEHVTDMDHIGKAGDEKHSTVKNPLKKVTPHDLRIGALFKGRVSAIESYGAFVDIGADAEGFIHISRLGRAFVKNVEAVVQIGEEVLVQVVDLDLKANRISFALRPDEKSAQPLCLRLPTEHEKEIIHKNAIRRSNKLTRNTAQRKRMTVEARQRVKAYRRTVLAEKMAVELRQAQIGFRGAVDAVDSMDEQEQVE